MFQINMPTLARKQQYKKEYSREFSGIKQGKDEYHAHCIPCSNEINLTSMGKAAIRVHQEKPKHKENAKAANTTRFPLLWLLLLFDLFRALSKFLPSRSAPTAIDDKTAAAEGAWAFHVATHNQSFSEDKYDRN